MRAAVAVSITLPGSPHRAAGASLRSIRWLVLACAAAGCAARATGPLPALPGVVTDVADAPFVSSLVGARSGDRIAWVVAQRGRRNVWVAAAPDYTPRPVTRFDRDDGQLVASLAFSDDGSRLVFVRGGGENAAGTHPNAASDPRGVAQEIWTVGRTGLAERVAEGHSPALSPDGRTVAFVHKDSEKVTDVWLAPAGGGTPKRAIALMGDERELAWSPDGARLAFVSHRGTHSYVGVYAPATTSVTWLAPAGNIDGWPRWSPDGARVAFLRSPAERTVKPRIVEGVWFDAFPIAWMVADVRTGEGRAIEAKLDPTGGFPQWGQDQPLLWAGARAAFSSERDGWIRIYSAPAAGGEPVALSPSECESELSGVSPDGATVFFVANCGDLERRHLWKAPAAGGAAVQLTRGASLQWGTAVLDGGRTIAVIDAGATTPPWPALVPVAGGESRRLAGAPVLRGALVEPELVRFPVPGTSVTVTGQLYKPANAAQAQGVLYLHGGPVRQMLSSPWHPMEYYHQSNVLTQRLVASGRVVLQLNYRLGVGYGRAFRRPKAAGAFGGAEYADVLAARDYLAARDDVRDDQVALWGGSYGGYLTEMMLGAHSSKFAGGVSVCGVSVWAARAKTAHPDDAVLMAKYTPMATVDTWTAPVLLLHGDDDRTVPFQDSLELAHRLRDRGKADVELIALPGEDHFFLRDATWHVFAKRSIAFYDRLLGALPAK